MAARHARRTTAHPDWRRHFRRSLALGFGALATALGIGILGYRFIVGQEWSLALLNASMILSGMGPVGDIPGVGARMMQAASLLATELVVVYMLTMALLYGITDSLFELARRRLLSWQR